jgi:hypothetical protein
MLKLSGDAEINLRSFSTSKLSKGRIFNTSNTSVTVSNTRINYISTSIEAAEPRKLESENVLLH